jgi:hypothetical protein
MKNALAYYALELMSKSLCILAKFVHENISNIATSIDIKSLQNRLLKVCYVPATSAGLPRLLFLLRPLTVLTKQTRKAVRPVKQSVLL